MKLNEEIASLSEIIKSSLIEINRKNLCFSENFSKQKIKELYAFKKKKKTDDFIKSFFNQGFDISNYYDSFANGEDIDPEKIEVRLEQFESKDKFKSNLFKLASLHWSVPVSSGYGRRIRYLVWDKNNNKLIGIIAIGDPVFNLKVRDDYLEWNAKEREKCLTHCMDAYVLGAIPPYNKLLSGKLMACILKSKEVYNDFYLKYHNVKSIIEQKKKKSRLLIITTTSSMGRSSVYNRLKINGEFFFKSLGYTNGWGHYHIPEELFTKCRVLLKVLNDPYANNYKFKQGPNFRIRIIRRVLSILGLSGNLLNHGIKREVFICENFSNSSQILKNTKLKENINELKSIEEITKLCKERWIIPRGYRDRSYRHYIKDDFFSIFGNLSSQLSLGLENGRKNNRTKTNKQF